MKKITLSNGETVEVECLSCALTNGLVVPEGGVVIETEYFHAHQDVAYPIRGLIILASKRHIKCLDDLTNSERLDYKDKKSTKNRFRDRTCLLFLQRRYNPSFSYLDGTKI